MKMPRSPSGSKGSFYNLACGRNLNPEFVNVDKRSDVGADLVADCLELAWMEDSSAECIFSQNFIEHLAPAELSVHLDAVKQKLTPDGLLVLIFPDVEKLVHGFICGNKFEALSMLFGSEHFKAGDSGHKWGWSIREVSKLLSEKGFAVEYAGHDYEVVAQEDLSSFSRIEASLE